MKRALGWWLVLSCGPLVAAGSLQVSALHPLLADLARQVGGARVEVHDLVGRGANLHRYEPRPADLKQMQGSALVLASGKGLEPYLGRLQPALEGVTIIEVGRTLPSRTIGEDEAHANCPEHGEHAAHGTSVDPHWWHSIDNMRRAARVVARALGDQDPEGKAIYLENASAYGQRLADLKRWATEELAKVPRGQRKLVTAHQAFGYFGNEFGFEVMAVAGLNNEQNPSPQELAETIALVKKAGVPAIFPEQTRSSKALEAVVAATGVRLAAPLIADGNGRGDQAGFEGMIRHNVAAITQALRAP